MSLVPVGVTRFSSSINATRIILARLAVLVSFSLPLLLTLIAATPIEEACRVEATSTLSSSCFFSVLVVVRFCSRLCLSAVNCVFSVVSCWLAEVNCWFSPFSLSISANRPSILPFSSPIICLAWASSESEAFFFLRILPILVLSFWMAAFLSARSPCSWILFWVKESALAETDRNSCWIAVRALSMFTIRVSSWVTVSRVWLLS